MIEDVTFPSGGGTVSELYLASLDKQPYRLTTCSMHGFQHHCAYEIAPRSIAMISRRKHTSVTDEICLVDACR